MSLIDLGEDHSITVLGLRRHGKTYGLLQSLAADRRGVFFFNSQMEDVPKGFVKADGKNSIDEIVQALKAGKKVNFIPTVGKRKNQLKTLIYGVYQYVHEGEKAFDIFFVVDEVHLYKKEVGYELMELSTTGNRHGIRPVFIAQRAAEVPYTLLTQTTLFVIFRTHMEDTYFKEKFGVKVVTEMQERFASTTWKYPYVTYDFMKLEGCYQV